MHDGATANRRWYMVVPQPTEVGAWWCHSQKPESGALRVQGEPGTQVEICILPRDCPFLDKHIVKVHLLPQNRILEDLAFCDLVTRLGVDGGEVVHRAYCSDRESSHPPQVKIVREEVSPRVIAWERALYEKLGWKGAVEEPA